MTPARPQRTTPAPHGERTIESLGPWFHNLHLPDGSETRPDHPFGDFPRFKWEQIAPHLPADLAGWRALDIGCNAGFYSIELARRGADVVAIDHDPHYLRQAEWAVERCGVAERVELREQGIYDLAAGEERFDLVLFMGVFYHLRYPLLGLDVVARLVDRLLVFQTLTMPGTEVADAPADFPLAERERMADPGWPRMAFLEKRFEDDPTNWWAPNHAAIEAMLRSTGMKVLAYPGDEIYLCAPDRGNPSHAITREFAAEYEAATRLLRRFGSIGRGR